MRSAVRHTSSASGRTVAPAARNSSSVIDDPSPAPPSTYTSWPLRANSLTPEGVMATRYSWFLTSRGIPTFTWVTPHSIDGGPIATVGLARSLDPRPDHGCRHRANYPPVGLTAW